MDKIQIIDFLEWLRKNTTEHEFYYMLNDTNEKVSYSELADIYLLTLK